MYWKQSLVKLLMVSLAVVCMAGMAAADQSEPPKPHMMYFYNPSCRLCTKTNEIVGEIEKKYDGVMSTQRFNISDPQQGMDNVLYMFELMDEMKVPEEDNITLVVFLGLLEYDDEGPIFTPKRVLVEGDAIIAGLETETADFLAKEGKGVMTPGVAVSPASFFYSHTALAAAPLPAGSLRPPTQDGTGTGAAGTLRPRIRRTAEAEDAAAAVSSRADAKLRFGAISLAALADSVNPCAFATIIILVAMMSSAKRTRKEIMAVCLAFTAAVFLTYLAIGLFLYKVIALINEGGGWFLVIADIIYYIAFLLCVVFGILSLWDAYKLFTGRAAEEMTLQLPKAFKKKINVAMAKGVRARWLMVGVFMAGVTVSFFEAACTGQVYLPTIISLAKISFWHSMLLLLWYNFLFILPLLIIFGLVLYGVTSTQLADFFKKNVAWTKLALGLVFVFMGLVIWYEMYWPPGYRGAPAAVVETR